MRYATLDLKWESGQFHPLDEKVASLPEVTFEATHYINPVGNGSYVELVRFHGDPTTLQTLFDNSESVYEYEIPEETEGFAYVHFESTPSFDAFLESVLEQTVVFQWPVEFIGDSTARGIRVTLMGTEDAISTVVSAFPANLSVTLLRTGEYTEQFESKSHELTNRQRRLLRTAIEMGYYEIPRETTQQELADALNVSPATVSDRVRRLEATIVKTMCRVE